MLVNEISLYYYARSKKHQIKMNLFCTKFQLLPQAEQILCPIYRQNG
jgi:hypothetical protein